MKHVGDCCSNAITGLTAQWQKFTVEFTASRSVDNASLTISPVSGSVNGENAWTNSSSNWPHDVVPAPEPKLA